MPKRLLIADDDRLFLNILSLEFEKRDAPVEVFTVEDGEHTITLLTEHKPDMLILDLRMPKVDGFAVLEHMQTHHTGVPVIVVTHYRDEEHKKRSEEYGVKLYMVKSEWRIGDMTDEIQKHLAEA